MKKSILTVACFIGIYGVVNGLMSLDGSASADSSTEATTSTNTGESDGTGTDNTARALTADDVRAKISDGAVDDLTDASEFPDLVHRIGKSGARDAMKGVKAATYRAARSPDCDAVDAAGPSDYPDKPFTKKHQEYFVNCANAKQWRFTAAELKDAHGKWYTAENAPAAGISDTDRQKAQNAAEQASAPGKYSDCENAIRARLDHPSDAEFHNLAGFSESFNAKNERFMNVDFEAKNEYGAQLSYTGQCIFHRDGTMTTQIFNR